MKKSRILGAVVDIAILAVLAVAVYAAVQFSLPREVAASGNTQIRYTIEIGGRMLENGEPRVFPSGFYRNIRVGDTLFDALRGLPIGEIVAVETAPFTVRAFDEPAGIIRQAHVPGFEFIYIVVETAAQIDLYETLVGPIPLQVGRNVAVRTANFASEGYIVAMEVL